MHPTRSSHMVCLMMKQLPKKCFALLDVAAMLQIMVFLVLIVAPNRASMNVFRQVLYLDHTVVIVVQAVLQKNLLS